MNGELTMKRSASEIIRNLETRIARLERHSTQSELPSVGDIYNFMIKSKTSNGGRVMRGVIHDHFPRSWNLSLEPSYRERLDHYGNDGEGWDSDGWWSDYAGPLEEEVNNMLTDKFPVLLKNRDKWSASVDEKGFIDIDLNKKTFMR